MHKFVIIVATCLHYVISLDRSSDPSGSVKWDRALVDQEERGGGHTVYKMTLGSVFTLLSPFSFPSINVRQNRFPY